MTDPATDPNAPTEIDQAAQRWREAKVAEDVARERRIAAEAELAELIGVEAEGSTKRETPWFNVTTTGKVNRTLDPTALDAVREHVPAPIFDRVIQYRPQLNLRELRYVEANEPDVYRELARAITAKPAKPTVKVEVK